MEPDYVKLKEVKPVLSGYIRASQALLKLSASPDEKAIHNVRVLMKKSRALVKLTVSQNDNIYYDRNISDLTEVGTIMCSWRETSVQRKLLKSFRRKNPEIFSRLARIPCLPIYLRTLTLKRLTGGSKSRPG